jgi:hypothetical protein
MELQDDREIHTVSLDSSGAKRAFPLGAQRLESPRGLKDILMGIDHRDEALRGHKRGPGLVL